MPGSPDFLHRAINGASFLGIPVFAKKRKTGMTINANYFYT